MILAIGRAERFSPNSAGKDRAILSSVCDALQKRGYEVAFAGETELDGAPDAEAYISMGRLESTLGFLALKEREGVPVINTPEGVAMCCSRRTINGLMAELNIPLPPAEGSCGYWLKRADGVSETKGDVVYVPSEDMVAEAVRDMGRRGVADIVMSAHVPGDLVKFYGVSGTGFFYTCYPGDDRQWKFGDEEVNGKPHHYPFDADELRGAVEKVAEAAGVCVYGGDCIVRRDGTFAVIDFNDWPSFSRCREAAAEAVAEAVEREIGRKRK